LLYFSLESLILKGFYVVFNNKKGRTILTLILVYFRFEVELTKKKKTNQKIRCKVSKNALFFDLKKKELKS